MTGSQRSRLFTTAAAAALAATFSAGAALAADPVPQNDILNATLWVTNSVEFKANAIAGLSPSPRSASTKRWPTRAGRRRPSRPAISRTSRRRSSSMPTRRRSTTAPMNPGWSRPARTTAARPGRAWVADAAAKAVPGAVDFTKYADSKGVKVFYVTNRTADQEEATRKNMEALGFPMGGNVDTFLMSKEKDDWTSKKGTRRAFVAQGLSRPAVVRRQLRRLLRRFRRVGSRPRQVARSQHGPCRP